MPFFGPIGIMILLAFLNARFPDANVWTWAAILFFGPLVCAAAYGLIWHELLKPLFLAARPTELAPVAARPSFKAPKWLVEGLIVAAIWTVFEAVLLLWAHWYGAPPTAPIFNLAPVIAFVMALIVRGTIWTALVKPLFVPAPRAPRKSFADKVEEFMADSPRR
jgi:hypothetical protein